MGDARRLLPVDQSSLRSVHERHMVIVDKTERMRQLLTCGLKYVFLGRPRRFGKSLLVDQMYWRFVGKREYFEGLSIHDSEQDWTPRPVIRLDLSLGTNGASGLTTYLGDALRPLEEEQGLAGDGIPLGNRLSRLIRQMAKDRQPAVLIDEYDAPLLNAWHNGRFDELAELYKQIFTTLKAEEGNLHFVFFTGCVRFNHMSLFSTLNNVKHISFDPRWADLCGFTEHEVVATYTPELALMASEQGVTVDEALASLRDRYDGYRFSLKGDAPAVYNPLSVCNALYDGQLGDYWVGSSSTANLTRVCHLEEMVGKLDGHEEECNALENSDVRQGNPIVFLYQAGYLTLDKRNGEFYELRIPNDEVRGVLYDQVLPLMLGRSAALGEDEVFATFRKSLLRGQLEEGLWALRTLLAGAPYSNVRVASLANEERMQVLTAALCYGARFHLVREQSQGEGTPDLVFKASSHTYVVELKRTCKGGLATAWRQLRERHYIEPFLLPGRTVVALALEVRDNGRAVIDYRARIYTPSKGDYATREVAAASRWRTALRGEEAPAP